jgi:hypothetical protein
VLKIKFDCTEIYFNGLGKTNIDLYQCTKIKPHGSEVARKHPEKVEAVTKPVNITAKSLLTISVCHFSLKLRDLI